MRLIQFYHLLIGNFCPELLVLIGDSETISELIDVQRELKTVIPSMIVCVSDMISKNATELCVIDCPKQRLTLIWLNDRYINQAYYMISWNNFASNRIVLIKEKKMAVKKLQNLVTLFGTYNAVIMEFGVNGNFQILAWGLTLNYGDMPISKVSRFDGPEAIFRSNDHNALAFRHNLQRWPTGKPVKSLFMTTLLPPYSFFLRIKEGKRSTIASPKLILLNAIGNILNLTLKIHFYDHQRCPLCFARSMQRNYHRVPLFNHDEVVKYEEW